MSDAPRPGEKPFRVTCRCGLVFHGEDDHEAWQQMRDHMQEYVALDDLTHTALTKERPTWDPKGNKPLQERE